MTLLLLMAHAALPSHWHTRNKENRTRLEEGPHICQPHNNVDIAGSRNYIRVLTLSMPYRRLQIVSYTVLSYPLRVYCQATYLQTGHDCEWKNQVRLFYLHVIDRATSQILCTRLLLTVHRKSTWISHELTTCNHALTTLTSLSIGKFCATVLAQCMA